MTTLYGAKNASDVYNRLEELDPQLNEEVQKIAYDHFWSRPGLSIRDKSLVTVASLVTMSKEEQLRIHLTGLLNSGGTVPEIREMLLILSLSVGADAALKGYQALSEVCKERSQADNDPTPFANAVRTISESRDIWNLPALTRRNKNIINVSSAVARGEQPSMLAAIRRFLDDGVDIDDLRNIMIHQIVYCGFPASMNGFAALQRIRQ